SAPCGRSAAMRRSRARPSEKYAASAPESNPEATISVASSNNWRTRLSPTEVFESRRHGYRPAAPVEPPNARADGDFSDGGEHRAGRLAQSLAQPTERVRLASHEQLVVFAASGGPVHGIDVERFGHDPSRLGNGQLFDGDAGADAALVDQAREIRRE